MMTTANCGAKENAWNFKHGFVLSLFVAALMQSLN